MNIQHNPLTDVDVQALMKIFGDVVADGREVTHAQIEAAISIPRLSSRYKTVTNKWRRQIFRERGVWFDGRSAEGRGFVALTPDEMVRFSNREVRSTGKKLKRAIAIAATPNDAELSDSVKHYRRLLMVAAEKIAAQHRGTMRELSVALAPQRQLRQKTA